MIKEFNKYLNESKKDFESVFLSYCKKCFKTIIKNILDIRVDMRIVTIDLKTNIEISHSNRIDLNFNEIIKKSKVNIQNLIILLSEISKLNNNSIVSLVSGFDPYDTNFITIRFQMKTSDVLREILETNPEFYSDIDWNWEEFDKEEIEKIKKESHLDGGYGFFDQEKTK
jgi:hypothetical protein